MLIGIRFFRYPVDPHRGAVRRSRAGGVVREQLAQMCFGLFIVDREPSRWTRSQDGFRLSLRLLPFSLALFRADPCGKACEPAISTPSSF